MTKKYKILRKDGGATATDYVLVFALIAVAAIAAITGTGDKLRTMSMSVPHMQDN